MNNNDKKKVYRFSGIHWGIDGEYQEQYYYGLCPKDRCHCRLVKSKEKYSLGEYKYECIKCDFRITLNKPIEDKAVDLSNVIEAEKYKDAEIINLDGDLIRIQREQITDTDYWADVKISKSRNGEVQLMVLAGSRKESDKAQLFIDPKKERFSFDQNNLHPREVFSVIEATFRSSKQSIKLDLKTDE